MIDNARRPRVDSSEPSEKNDTAAANSGRIPHRTRPGSSQIVKRGKQPGKVRKGEFSPPDESLWESVHSLAKWRDCYSHGKVERPVLRLQTFKNGTQHCDASCPKCGQHLGFLGQAYRPCMAYPEEVKRADCFKFIERALKDDAGPAFARDAYFERFHEHPPAQWVDEWLTKAERFTAALKQEASK